jgi:hypothetical protein
MFFSPIAGYNMYNGAMLGLAYYNHTLFEKKFETELAPMYAFGNKDISGIVNARLNLHPKSIFSTINIGFKSQRFSFRTNEGLPNGNNVSSYNKFAPYINLDFKKKHATSLLQQRLTYRYVEIMNGSIAQQNYNYGVHDLTYQLANHNALYPALISLNGQVNADMQKVFVTITQKIHVSKTYFFEVRAFAGLMGLNTNSNGLVSYSFKMGGFNGNADYLYDNLYFGRSETNGVAAAQFAETNGAFKASTGYIGQSNNWLVSCNIKSPKLFKLPLLFYADIGT